MVNVVYPSGMEFGCSQCSAVFRTHAEVNAHQRSHLGGGRPTPGMKKDASLRANLRHAAEQLANAEEHVKILESHLQQARRENNKLRAQIEALKIDRANEEVERRKRAEERERQQAIAEAVGSFTDEDLEAMGVTREQAEAVIPTPVQSEPPIVLDVADVAKAEVDWYLEVESAAESWRKSLNMSAAQGTAFHEAMNRVINTGTDSTRQGPMRMVIGPDGLARPAPAEASRGTHDSGYAVDLPMKPESLKGMHVNIQIMDEMTEELSMERATLRRIGQTQKGKP